MPNKDYLGDSVYANTDGFILVLTTENGLPSDPSNQIFIEPYVFLALINYAERHSLFKQILEGRKL